MLNVAQQAKKIGDFLILNTIGEGTFGKVKQGIHMPSGHKVAIKILQKHKITQDEDLQRVHNQLRILYNKVDHCNVIKLLQLHENAGNIYIVTEFIEGQELYQVVVQKGYLQFNECGRYFSQLVQAIGYLHQLGICHRDIKPENIMVMGNDIKLIDFGLSKQFGQNRMLETSCGSPCYAAPQMLQGTRYDCVKTDIWAMGVTLYAMAAGRLPFDDQNTQRLYELINIGQFYPLVRDQKGFTQYSELEQINGLLKQLLKVNPDQRPSIEQIKQHKWVQRYRKNVYIPNPQHSSLKCSLVGQYPYQDDTMLVESMSKYFKKSVNQIRDIIEKKSIISICTYYWLNRRKQVDQIVKGGKCNVQKKDINTNKNMKSPLQLAQKTKSYTTISGYPSSITKQYGQKLTKDILKQILAQKLGQKQMREQKQNNCLNKKDMYDQASNNDNEEIQIHYGAFCCGLVFENLSKLRHYVQNVLTKDCTTKQKQQNQNNYQQQHSKQNNSNHHQFQEIQEEEQELSDQEQNWPGQDNQKNIKECKLDYNSNQVITDEEEQQQYALFNNKYVLNSKKNREKIMDKYRSTTNTSSKILKNSQKLANPVEQPDIKVQSDQCAPVSQNSAVKYLSKYQIVYNNMCIKIKKIANSQLYYLDLPVFFN